jgi:SAM-dependent MidA family methyltransferase
MLNDPLNILAEQMPRPTASNPTIADRMAHGQGALTPHAQTPIANTPPPSLEQLDLSKQLCDQMFKASDAGWLSFEQFMQMALYQPSLGYYAAGQQKFGASGDFVTAPMISPLFALALANQLAQWLKQCEARVYEFGAGDGQLAAQLLVALADRSIELQQYCIVELSPDLQERQHQTIKQSAPHLLDKVVWLDQLPEVLNGVVLGNELLDAMPVHIFELQPSGILEKGVLLTPQTDENNPNTTPNWLIQWASKPSKPDFNARVTQTIQAVDPDQQHHWPIGFESEICTAAAAWTRTIGSRIQQGALLLIDYGFSNAEYYLPSRNGGTLMCHYRHYAHSNPLALPGLQDITAHVDFTAIAQQAVQNGLDLLGYTSQARFLLNCDLLTELTRASEDLDQQALVKLNQGVQRLVSEAEMGELFKVVAFGRGLTADTAIGFSAGDRSHSLGVN